MTRNFDFESGPRAGSWNRGPGTWGTGVGTALIGNGHGFARIDGIGPISSLKFRFELQDGSSAIHAIVFETFEPEHTRYFVALGPTGATLFRQEGSTCQQRGEEPMKLPLNQIHHATVLVGGGSFDLFVDGEAVVGADGAAPPPTPS